MKFKKTGQTYLRLKKFRKTAILATFCALWRLLATGQTFFPLTTAWISKLAQRIACLHFGFQFANNVGERKVFTVSGGVTSRIRSAYKLNRLLHNDLKTEDALTMLNELKNKLSLIANSEATEKLSKKIEELIVKINETGFLRKYLNVLEELEKEILSNKERLERLEKLDEKNRDNEKHHALDAMCLCYAPIGKDAKSVKFDKIFPVEIKSYIEDYFRNYLNKIVPNPVAVKKPRLEETFYSKRNRNGESIMVGKTELVKLAYDGKNPKYNLDILKGKKTKNGNETSGRIERVINPYIKNLIKDFIKTNPTEDEWKLWCKNLRLPSKYGLGTRVKRVLCFEGEIEEYQDLSKDFSGAYKKGKGGHQGQIVWKNTENKYKVEPIYVHSSKFKVIETLKRRSDFIEILGFYQKSCLVQFEKDVINKDNKQILSQGIYKLRTLRTDGYAAFADSNGNKSNPISLEYLIKAGMKRIKLD